MLIIFLKLWRSIARGAHFEHHLGFFKPSRCNQYAYTRRILNLDGIDSKKNIKKLLLPDNTRFISCATGLIFSQTITLQLRVSEYCFTSLYAQSWQYRDRRRPEAGTMPYSYFEWLQGFIIVHSTIGSTVHSRPLNSLYMHCKCTTKYPTRPGFEHGTLGYKLQSRRMSHRDRPATSKGIETFFCIFVPS